jgi:hypothetical protein
MRASSITPSSFKEALNAPSAEEPRPMRAVEPTTTQPNISVRRSCSTLADL